MLDQATGALKEVDERDKLVKHFRELNDEKDNLTIQRRKQIEISGRQLLREREHLRLVQAEKEILEQKVARQEAKKEDDVEDTDSDSDATVSYSMSPPSSPVQILASAPTSPVSSAPKSLPRSPVTSASSPSHVHRTATAPSRPVSTAALPNSNNKRKGTSQDNDNIDSDTRNKRARHTTIEDEAVSFDNVGSIQVHDEETVPVGGTFDQPIVVDDALEEDW